MRTSAPIQVIVHPPATQEGRRELARRVTQAHADFVISTIDRLDCPMKQKLELLQSVIDTVKGTDLSKKANADGDETGL